MKLPEHFDHIALSGLEDPFDTVGEMLQRCPVAYSEEHGGFWVLSRYRDVCAAARDPHTFSSEARGASIPHHGFPMPLSPIEIDPPRHMQYRGPLLERFSPQGVEPYRDETRRVVTALIDEFIEAGECDLAQDLIGPMVAIIATEFLGIPTEKQKEFHEWAGRLLRAGDLDAIAETLEYFGVLYDERTEHPTDDMASLVLSLVIDGEPIREEQFLITMSMLFAAGLDTTSNTGGHIVLFLDRHPEIGRELAADLSKIPLGVEELLRYLTPLPLLARTATRDVEIDGRQIAAGERVTLHWMAANRDPEEFPDPDEFVIDRAPNRHLAFGMGPHRCLGSNLARMELRVLLEELLTRLPDFQVVHDGVSRYCGLTRGVDRIPVTFTPGERRVKG